MLHVIYKLSGDESKGITYDVPENQSIRMIQELYFRVQNKKEHTQRQYF